MDLSVNKSTYVTCENWFNETVTDLLGSNTMVTKFIRFKDLKEKGIVNSWPALRYKIEHNGFPPGCYLGTNSRAWKIDEVQAWIDALPTKNPRQAPHKFLEPA